MLTTESGSATRDKQTQPLNALRPIATKCAGSLTSISPVQPLKAL
jgi:hypothetical protein